MSFKLAGSGVTTLYCSSKACKAEVLCHLKCPEGTNKIMQERKKQEDVLLLATADAKAEFLPEI